jgi:hypothetical protein
MKEATLSCVLPPYWQQLDLERLMKHAEQVVVEREPAFQMLVALKSGTVTEPFVLTAVRFRLEERAFDFLGIALPDPAAKVSEYVEPARETNATADLTNGPAISHRSDATAGNTWLPSSVQVVLLVPPSHRGAVVTLLSSERGSEAMLETEAESIASSLRIARRA